MHEDGINSAQGVHSCQFSGAFRLSCLFLYIFFSGLALNLKILMEFDERLSSLFIDLCTYLRKEDVQLINLSLSVNPDHHWPRLDPPLTAEDMLMRMRDHQLWMVDPTRRVCNLSFLSDRLERISRRDLSAKVNEFGQICFLCLTFRQRFLRHSSTGGFAN